MLSKPQVSLHTHSTSATANKLPQPTEINSNFCHIVSEERRREIKEWPQRSTKEVTISDMQILAILRFPTETKLSSVISKSTTYI